MQTSRTDRRTLRARSRVRRLMNRRAGGLEAVSRELPVRGGEKGVDVLPTLRAVVAHIRVLEDVHQEEHWASGEMPPIVFVHPDVEEAACFRIPDERSPTDPPQTPGRTELLLPCLVRAEVAADLRPEAVSPFQARPLFCQ